MDLALHRKKDHVITDGILITRYMMVIYRDLENGVQKKTYDFICSLYVVNKWSDHINVVICGMYEDVYLSRYLPYVSDILLILWHTREDSNLWPPEPQSCVSNYLQQITINIQLLMYWKWLLLVACFWGQVWQISFHPLPPLRGTTLHCFSETETIPRKNIHATMFYKNWAGCGGCLSVKK